jgi:hypothetical protein
MKTSWNDTKQIERYLNNELAIEDHILFEAQLLIDPLLKLNVGLQKSIYTIVKLYGRKKIKTEVEQVHNRLFHDKKNIVFQQHIHHLFKK